MAEKKNIWITGANGQLGMEFRDLEKDFPGFNFFFTGKDEVDISGKAALESFARSGQFHFCINCAAYTAVDKAETENALAENVNAHAAADLAGICADLNIRFIHFSTDYVFNGQATTPYHVNDPIDPVNAYGASKLMGEKLVIDKNRDAVIIRTSWVYSTHGKNFVKTMLRLMKEKEFIAVVNDQFGSPTYAADLALAILQIAEGKEFHAGIYHYCNSGVITWYDFAIAIKNLTGSGCTVSPIETSEYPTPAKRPAYSALDTIKFREEYDVTIHGWKQSLENCLSKGGYLKTSADAGFF